MFNSLLSKFTPQTVISASIAALTGLNVGWHISMIHSTIKSFYTDKSRFFPFQGVPNMPQNVITKCIDGTWSPNRLPACLPMSDSVW